MNSFKKLCSSCGKSIATGNIARHQAAHDAVIIQCQHCCLRFTRKDNYKRHLNAAHANVQADAFELPNALQKIEFTIDDEKVIDSIVNFKVTPPNVPLNKTPDFIHPFTCKVMGPRGSGKTSFAISYIQQTACLTFQKTSLCLQISRSMLH